MALVLKRIVWPDGSSRPDDFNIYEGDLQAGRIYRMTSTATVRWWWGINAERAPLRGRQQGIADTLDDTPRRLSVQLGMRGSTNSDCSTLL
jgi:hypothetical protein